MNPLLSVESISVRFDHRTGSRTVLDEVSLRVQRGEWLALLGPNGSGKSTLLAAITHRLATSSGRIVIAGFEVAARSEEARRRLGFSVAPDELPPELTPRQCLEVFAYAHALEAPSELALEAAAALGLTPYLDQPVRWLSLGTKQKVAVVLALTQAPPLLLLDEVFNGLDARSGPTLAQLLRREVDAQRIGIVMATHSLSLVERYCTHVATLHEGELTDHWALEHATTAALIEARIAHTLTKGTPSASGQLLA